MPEKWHNRLPKAVNIWDKYSFQVEEWFCTWSSLFSKSACLLTEITVCTLEAADVKIYILCMSFKRV